MLLYLLTQTIIGAFLWIALPNSNMHIVEQRVLNISNPLHPNYGHYMSNTEINKLTKSSDDHINLVYNWLKISNITNCQLLYNYIKCDDTLENYMRHCNIETITDPCKIPSYLTQSVLLIDGIKPKILSRYMSRHMLDVVGVVTRDVIKRIYNISDYRRHKGILGSLGIAEFQNNTGFLNNELIQMQAENDIIPHIVSQEHTIGNNTQPTDLESDLDISMIAQTSGNTSELWYWNNAEWMFAFATDLLAADNVPEVLSISWGWSDRDQCSIVPCNDTNLYVRRTNEEFMKIALRGITLIASSGDSGSCGRSNGDCDKCDDGGTECGVFPLNPVFPTSSPYVLSVGGTELIKDVVGQRRVNYTTPVCMYNVSCSQYTTERPSMSPFVGWTTGGGFSNIFKRPHWQRKFTKKYINTIGTLPNRSYFGTKYRGYPDITGVSNQCSMIIDGEWDVAAGTSCSSPIWAGIIGIINQHQKKKGRPVVGLVAPLLYQIATDQPNCFNGIKEGNTTSTESNAFCGKDFGFISSTTITGSGEWNPVAGLGSPNVGCILEYLDIKNR